MMYPQKVLVTGGEGFIGRHTKNLLDTLGIEVWSFDRLVGFGMGDTKILSEGVKWADAVIHLAGLLGTAELYSDAHKAVDANVHGTLNLLEAMADASSQKHLVLIDQPHIWRNVYEATHACATHMAEGFMFDFGVPLDIVVAYNAYGPGQAVGPTHPRKIIPTFSDAAWHGRPIMVNGDGKQVVDLVYVGDVARCLVHALLEGEGKGLRWHAGTGVPVTVNRVAEFVQTTVAESGGPVASIQHTGRRQGENGKHIGGCVSPDLNYCLNWTLLKATIQWYRPPYSELPVQPPVEP